MASSYGGLSEKNTHKLSVTMTATATGMSEKVGQQRKNFYGILKIMHFMTVVMF